MMNGRWLEILILIHTKYDTRIRILFDQVTFFHPFPDEWKIWEFSPWSHSIYSVLQRDIL